MNNVTPTLYQRVLGPRFAALDPVLQRFHASPTGGTASCRFQVIHGRGWIPRLLARGLRLPPEQDSAEAWLEVTIQGQGERWTRSFGRSKLVSHQKAADSMIAERAGPVCFGLIIDIVDGGMRLHTKRAWFLGVPLPFWLSPTVEATVVPNLEGWSLVAKLTLPWVGHLIQYQGEIRISH